MSQGLFKDSPEIPIHANVIGQETRQSGRQGGVSWANQRLSYNFTPVFPAKDEHDRRATRPIGRDSDLYYKIVHEWSEIIQAADQMGVWACRPSSITCIPRLRGGTESRNPERPLGQPGEEPASGGLPVMSWATQDPIRVAEETAIIDHLTHGKYFVGFARATSPAGQYPGPVQRRGATISDAARTTTRTRENLRGTGRDGARLLDQGFRRTERSFYQAPFPHDAGIEGYEGTRLPARPVLKVKSMPTACYAGSASCPNHCSSPHPPCLHCSRPFARHD